MGGRRQDDPERLAAELAVVREIARVLTSTLELREVLRRILERVGELLEPRRWSLLLLDESTSSLQFELVVGEGEGSLWGLKVEVGQGIAGWVAEHKEPLLVRDVSADERFDPQFDERTGLTTHSVVAVPMCVGERVLGVIELVAGPDDRAFDESDLRTITYIADYAAIAIENARNYDRVQSLSIQDEHTGLYNARFLFRYLRMEIERSKRHLHPFSLIFFDLDHFKLVNDRHGHLCGSATLREVGDLVLKTVRTSDLACRYGGDEFVVILPETGRDDAMAIAGRLREAMKEEAFLADRGLALHITASFGVATFPDDARTSEDLLSRSDRAMYQVKADGRDGIRAAKPIALTTGEPAD